MKKKNGVEFKVKWMTEDVSHYDSTLLLYL